MMTNQRFTGYYISGHTTEFKRNIGHTIDIKEK